MTYGPNYQRCRAVAFARFSYRCVVCGGEAEEAHHWAKHYPPEDDLTVDDLVPMCLVCHKIATDRRRFQGAREEDVLQELRRVREAVAGRRINLRDFVTEGSPVWKLYVEEYDRPGYRTPRQMVLDRLDDLIDYLGDD